MLQKNEWWEVIGTYNDGIYPLQWIGLIAIGLVTVFLIMGESKRGNILIKSSLFLMNIFIGVRFFIGSEGFPLGLKISQGILFISIGLLIGIDLKRNQLQFEFPKKGWRRIFFIIGMLVMTIYPFVGGILGKDLRYWIMPGTLPCPTTAYTLLLMITAKKRENIILFFLLLLWAIPFPPLVQIPKYQVYEDGIMFFLGLVALPIFIKDIIKRIRKNTKKGRNY